MKKGITPIIAVIILLLITVALAGLAWTFLSGYFSGMTAQNIQLIDYSCSGGAARVIIRNAGTQGIDVGTGTCSGTGADVGTCGIMTVVKTAGGNFPANPTISPSGTIAAGSTTTFTSTGLGTGTHTFRFTTTTGAGGPSPNVATVSC